MKSAQQYPTTVRALLCRHISVAGVHHQQTVQHKAQSILLDGGAATSLKVVS
jgi:hypothetical protein